MTSRSSRSKARLLLAVVAAPCLTGCVAGDYGKFRVYQPPAVDSVQALQPGTTDLSGALDSLGAPLHVIELGQRLVLAWGWQATTDWNVEVSAPIGDAQGNFQYSSSDERTEGLVLVFDELWTLEAVFEGHLVDLIPKDPLPRFVDEEASENPRE